MLRPVRRVAPTFLLAAPLACGDSLGATVSTGADAGTTVASSSESSGPAPLPTGTGELPGTSTAGDPGSDSGGDTGPAPDLCAELPPLTTSGLVFSGDSRVVMGLAPGLGLEQFTLETWVRRDGRGTVASTGVGGLKLVPLITKGRGESDGSEVDCNYAFGFLGEVLAADFEDMATGANHPVYGKTAVPLGSWHHVAATYDGGSWRLYLDGVLDAERVVDAVPRFDSIQHFGLGAAFNSKGVPAGGFHGALDEVRVYARALGAAEIQATMNSSLPAPGDLVAHYRLDAADDDARDLVGDAPGAIEGATFELPGAVLDRGGAVVLADPRSMAAGGDTYTLAVDISDPEGDPVEVEFFARELTPADDFTLVALPDTQYYTRDADPPDRPEPDDPELFNAQTRWAWDNRVVRNVVGLFHLGDIINNSDVDAQWQRASKAMAILEDTSDPLYPFGLPHAVSFGNHDLYPKDEPEATAVANSHFGVDRYQDRPYYGGNFDGDNDENFVILQAGGLQVIVVSLQFNPAPAPELLAWVRSVFESHPRAIGIIATHYIVTGGGGFSPQGAALWEALKDVDNLQLMASGHVAQAARRSDEYAGNVIHSMLSDYQRSAPDPNNHEQPVVVEQSQTNGGRGYMRIWQFEPSRQKLYVESYSPKNDAAYTDEQNEFELDVDILGAGGPFASLGVVPAVNGTARVDLPGVAAGGVYEWYAVASDCSHSTTLALQQIDRSP